VLEVNMSRPISVVCALLAIAACDTADGPIAPPTGLSADRFGRPDIVVHPGGSIQAAVAGAAPGSVIRIEPGTYREAVTVNTPRLALVGALDPRGAGVVIENPGGADNGITVNASAQGFALVNVTVRGFDENGIKLSSVDGFLLSQVTAVDDGEYGLYPVHSSNGVIERCRASGHDDTGIYVGQSHDVTIRQSVTFANVNGIEVENSKRVTAIANDTYDNVVGILVVLLPHLEDTVTSDVLLAGNRVHDNNHPNFAPAGDLASFVPTGSGILVVGADRTKVEGNTVSGNQFTGIAVGSTLLLGLLAGLPPDYFADIEPNPDHDAIEENVVTGNGTVPSPVPFLPAADLLWDGSGTGDCWSANTFVTSAPPDLPACQ